ncbi:unnamed protein product [Symbiodinium pilosum]|uniref:ADF-H domain-containing protein n=1 Tax=Symbiodinium pilosum TaxID=2952 RepID=A0A812IZN0_SYMPI|nr:unnamed protein product [Symbiodinium pilosum]
MDADLPVVVLGAGSGGIAELQLWIDDSTVQWALLEFCIGEGPLARQRMLFLHVNGERCSPIARGRANELTPEVQRLMRGLEVGEAYHATLEVKTAEEVSLDSLLERVLPFFTVVLYQSKGIQKARMKVCAQLIQVEFEKVAMLNGSKEEQLSSAKAAATVASSAEPEEGIAANLRSGEDDAGGYQTSLGGWRNGRDALKAVGEPLGAWFSDCRLMAWNWAFFRADHVDLQIVGGGTGSLDEMKACYEEHSSDVLFGLLRLGFGEGRLRRTKYVFIHANGEKVPVVARGKLSAERPKMEEVFSQFASISVTMEILHPADLTLANVVERVRRAAVVDDDVLGRDAGSPSVFSVEAFQKALQEEKLERASELQTLRRRSTGLRSGLPANLVSEWAGRPLTEVVSLVHKVGGPLNWALFGPDPSWLSRRRTVKTTQASLLPDQVAAPSGGYLRAEAEQVSRASTPVRERPTKAEEPDSAAKDTAVSCNSTAADSPVTPAQEEQPDDAQSEDDTPKGSVPHFPGLQHRISGPLLKQSSAWHGRWQLRWMEVKGGHLMWWHGPTFVSSEPLGVLPLAGVKVQGNGNAFTLVTAGGKHKAYHLSADVDESASAANWIAPASWPKAKYWIQALEQESLAMASGK